jgi:hypothetical protein
MRFVLPLLGVAILAACADSGDRDNLSGEAAGIFEQEARQRCAIEGKRAQLRNTNQNLDGSRRNEYVCVQ